MLYWMLWSLLAVSAFLLAYPFTLYPLLLAMLPKAAPPRLGNSFPKRAALLFAARDEAQALPMTLRALARAQMTWPGLRILAWDDGSQDETGRILRAARPLVATVHADRPVGKAEGLRRLIDASDADILILMDANVRFTPETLRHLVAPFAAPEVGAVGGRLIPSGSGSAVGRAYWRLEETVKRLETRSGSTIGCDGALWAIRRSLYPRFGQAASDDFRPSMEALLAGYRVVSQPLAVVHEDAVADRHGFERAARIACGAWHAHRQIRHRLGALRPLDRFKYVSHKLVRWFAGLWLVLAGISALGLLAWHGSGLFALALAAAGWLAMLAELPGVTALRRVCEGFLGTTWGVLRAMRGRAQPHWTPVRA